MTLPHEHDGVVVPDDHPVGSVCFLLCVAPDTDELLLTDLLEGTGTARVVPLAPAAAEVGAHIRDALADAGPDRPTGTVVRWRDIAGTVRAGSGRSNAFAPGQSGGHRWRTTLDEALPGLRYVRLLRREKPRTAPATPEDPGGPLREEDWRWSGFFAWAGVPHLDVAVEDLRLDPDGTLARVRRFLQGDDAPLPDKAPRPRLAVVPQPRHRRRRARPRVSVVVVSHNEGENLPLTVSGIRATTAPGVEVVVVDDCSTDGSVRALDDLPDADVHLVRTAARRGVTGSRNAGAAASRGDVVVFADAHVDPSPGWLEALCLALDDPSVACAAPSISQIHQRGARGYGFTWREPRLRMRWLPRGSHAIHEVPFACGCLMAFRRDDFEAVGGFDEGLVRWGSEDAEIGLALWRRDRRTVVVPESVVAHLFRPVGPYVVPSELVVHNALRMATVHLGVRAVERVIASYEQLDCFPAAFARLVDSDVWARRDRLAAESAHDGEWFVDRFRIGALR